jgi:hypothetical protein
MRWHHLSPGRGVLEIDGGSPFATATVGSKPPGLELELAVWWGGGEPTRAAWLWSQTGRVASWAVVGEA